MSIITVVSIIESAQTILQDKTGTRWPVLELQQWLNASYREIVNLRPDANSLTTVFTCGAGPRQYLLNQFPDALRLIDVVRNVTTGSNMGAVKLIDQSSMDESRPYWYGEAQTVNLQLYMFDPKQPKEFLVYPPASSSAQLELIYSQMPALHTLTQTQLNNPSQPDTINLDDSYTNPILDYILYRCFSKDSEYQLNAQRAIGHYQAMQNALGVKTSSDTASQPRDK